MKKKHLRKLYLEKFKSINRTTHHGISLQICENLFGAIRFSKLESVHIFLPINKNREVDTNLVIRKIWREFPKIETIVPRINRELDRLEHLEYKEDSPMRVSDWGISEPLGDRLVDEKKIDLVIVPLLCFDTHGDRVGYGKGYYDRFLRLTRSNCQKIGVSMFPPVSEIEDVNEFDIPLDACITPDEVFCFQGTRR